MRIAVIGAGMMGHEIADVLTARGIYHTLLGHDRIEVTDPVSVARAIEDADVVVYAAASHRLAECEANPERAYAVNHEGAGRVAIAVPTVYLSSDYVFADGGPHSEELPGQFPRSIYGKSKMLGEIAVLSVGGIVVRLSGVYGNRWPSHKGPTFPETILSSHDPLRLPTDQVFSPTYAPDAAEVIVALALSLAGDPAFHNHECNGCRPNGIYHAANDGSTSWAAFGQEIADLARHDRHISGYEAKDPLRPRNSSLVSTRLPPLRHYKQALQVWSEKR